MWKKATHDGLLRYIRYTKATSYGGVAVEIPAIYFSPYGRLKTKVIPGGQDSGHEPYVVFYLSKLEPHPEFGEDGHMEYKLGSTMLHNDDSVGEVFDRQDGIKDGRRMTAEEARSVHTLLAAEIARLRGSSSVRELMLRRLDHYLTTVTGLSD